MSRFEAVDWMLWKTTAPSSGHNIPQIVSHILQKAFFRHALERIRDIRASEKVFYRQALKIYATSIDYDPKAEISIAFFIKMPFAAKILNEM